MTTMATEVDWHAWLARWHRQQERYLHERPRRFAIMLDYVARLRDGDSPALIDLCCGPGSITAAALARFEKATVVVCDIDPWLVEMGRRTIGPDPRVRWLEADLRREGWTESLPRGGYDAVLTSTALHRLHRDELVPPRGVGPVEFHREALLAAGFAEVGEVWRDDDDAILLAIR